MPDDYRTFDPSRIGGPLSADTNYRTFDESRILDQDSVLDYRAFDPNRLLEPSTSDTFSPKYEYDLLQKRENTVNERLNSVSIDEAPPKGVISSLGRGLAEGLLGPLYDAPGPGEAATFSEELAYSLGQIGGSVPGFMILSSITGGAAIPLAGARTASAVTKLAKMGRAARKLQKVNKRVEQLKKTKDWENKSNIFKEVYRLENRAKGLKSSGTLSKNAYDKLLDEFKREQIEKGITPRAIDNLMKKASAPQASGLLGRRKAYQEFIYGIGKKNPIMARYANHLANNIATFGMHGMLMAEGSLEDRFASLDESAISALVFATAGLPRFAGLKNAKFFEPAGVMLAGAASDLGRSDMSFEDRMVSGLSLVAFHYAMKGVSNIGIKERQVQALVDLGYPMEKALKLVEYRNNGIMLGNIRNRIKEKGTTFREIKDHGKHISLVRTIKGDKDTPERILYLDNETNTFGEVRGKNAWKKFSKKYEKFDPKDERLLDDKVKERDSIPEGPTPEQRAARKEHKKKAGFFSRVLNKDRGVESPEELHRVKNKNTGEQKWVSKKEDKKLGKEWEPDTPLRKLSSKEKESSEMVVDEGIRGLESDISKLVSERKIVQKEQKDIRQDILQLIPNINETPRAREARHAKTEALERSSSKLRNIQQQLKNKRAMLGRRKLTRESDITTRNNMKMREDGMGNDITTRYRPKIYTTITGKRRTFYSIDQFGNPADYMYKTRAEAIAFGDTNWVGSAGRRILSQKRDHHNKKIDDMNISKDFISWEGHQNKLRGLFRGAGIDKKGRTDVINAFYPDAKGDINNLTGLQMHKIGNVLRDRGPVEWYERDYHHLPPEGFMGDVSLKWSKFREATNRVVLPFSTYVEMLGSKVSQKISSITREHSLIRSSVAGKFTELQRDIEKVAKVPGREISKYIYPFLDEKYHFLRDKAWEKTLRNKKIETPDGQKTNAFDYILKRHKQVMDEVAKEMISNGVWVKQAKAGVSMSRFVEPVGNDGKVIHLMRPERNPVLYEKQVQSFLVWAKGDKNHVIVGETKAGKELVKRVNRKLSKNHYQAEYMRRQVSKDFLNVLNYDVDNGVMKSAWENRIARSMMRNDREIKELRVKDEVTKRMRDATEAEKMDAAKIKWREISQYIDPKGIVGQPWVRTADLDPFFFFERKPDGRYEMLDMESSLNEKGQVYKKGDSVVIDGRSKKIDRVVSTYETDYSEVTRRYGNSVSHAIATYGTYTSKAGIDTPWVDKEGTTHHKIKPGNVEGYIAHLLQRVNDAHGSNYTKWIEKGLRRQTMGEAREGFLGTAADLFEKVARFTAVAGLSSPTSGIKNFLLGQTQNAVVFTRRELIKGLGDSLGDFKNQRRWADRIGASYTGAYELFFEPSLGSGKGLIRILGKTGGMRPTEIFNRMVAGAIGPHALRGHVSNLANIKVPHMTGVSKNTSLRILSDVFKFSDGKIADMIETAKVQNKRGIPVDDLMFNIKDLTKARQQAHLVTQGSPDLPYVPLWASEAWAKPLTLFYRIAYRITDTTSRNVIKPILTNGNMAPAMKYIAGAVGSGAALYGMYDLLFDEQRRNRFKGKWNDPNIADYLAMFIKAEGLGLFSNTFDDHGGIVESYKPALFRTLEAIATNTWAIAEDKKKIHEGVGDMIGETIAVYNASMRVYENLTDSKRHMMQESRRRQTQFLDVYHPKENLNLEHDDALTVRSPYYRDLSVKFWLDDRDEEAKAKAYWVSLMFIRDRLIEGGLHPTTAAQEANKRIKGVISRQRPVPTSWREKKKGRKYSNYMEYLGKLDREERREEVELDNIYKEQYKSFYRAAKRYKEKYYFTWEK
jgi:hypothetical protein